MQIKEYQKMLECGVLVKIVLSSDGIEIFKELPKSYYTEHDGVIIAFDLTNNKSFDRVSEWLTTIQSEDQNKPLILIGLNCDLE